MRVRMLHIQEPSFKAIDTILLALKSLVKKVANTRLETLVRYFEIADRQFHRALPDAKLVANLYFKLI